MRFLVGYHGPAGHAMVFVMLFKRLGRNGEAIHQTRTTHQLASSLTLSQVNLAAFAGRTSADLPRFPPSQKSAKPLFLADESAFRGAPDTTTLTCALLHPAFPYIATKDIPPGIENLRVLCEARCTEFRPS